MRMIARFHKDASIGEISHLDTMRAVQRALRRADIPAQYSQGFHPHLNLAFASALGVGLSSCAEWMDVPLEAAMTPEAFMAAVAPHMPEGMKLEEAHAVGNRYPALMSITGWADYYAHIAMANPPDEAALQEKTQDMLGRPIVTMKKSKKGMKEVDIQPMIAQMESRNDEAGIAITLRCVHAPDGALNPLLFLPIWMEHCGLEGRLTVMRTAFWAEFDGKMIPMWSVPEKEGGSK